MPGLYSMIGRMLAVLMLVSWTAVADEGAAPYQPSATLEQDVDATLRAARDSGKLALFALGANWCHDSQALAANMQTAALSEVLEDHYVTQLVDVGYYGPGIAVAQRFGRPTIYSTPTVLVIDPVTGAQVNEGTMHRWSSAADMDLDAMADHLIELAQPEARTASESLTPAQQAAIAQLRTFEDGQRARLAKGYAVVGAELSAMESGAPNSLNTVWRPFSQFRARLMQDVTAFHQHILAAADQDQITLSFPVYAPLPWEGGVTEAQ